METPSKTHYSGFDLVTYSCVEDMDASLCAPQHKVDFCVVKPKREKLKP